MTGESSGAAPTASAPGQVAAGDPAADLMNASPGMKLLATRMGRETEDLEVVQHADGRRSVSLKGRFHHMSAMVEGADGKKAIRCFSDFDEMAEALAEDQPVDPSQPPAHVR